MVLSPHEAGGDQNEETAVAGLLDPLDQGSELPETRLADWLDNHRQ